MAEAIKVFELNRCGKICEAFLYHFTAEDRELLERFNALKKELEAKGIPVQPNGPRCSVGAKRGKDEHKGPCHRPAVFRVVEPFNGPYGERIRLLCREHAESWEQRLPARSYL